MRLQVTKVQISKETDVVTARQRAKQVAKLIGFDAQDQTRIATAVSEIARNAYEYAKRGNVSIYLLDESPQRLLIEIGDRGGGIANVQEILNGRYKSKTGMGVGLIGAKKLMDSFTIESSSEGTTVNLGKYLPVNAVSITKESVHKFIDALTLMSASDPLEEMRQQNQELVDTLNLLRDKQEELKSLNLELESTNRGVVALYSELDEKAQALQTANQVKTRFLSNVTHELRTPVNSISNVIRILLDGLEGPLSDGQRKSIEMVDRSARSLSEMINDLLDLAKVEAGKITVRPKEFDVSEVMTSLGALFKPMLSNNSSVRLTFDEPAGKITMFSDEGKISQILRNLVANALKFTERGEVRISAVKTSPDLLRLLVTDTGIGIEKKDLEHIFDEFVQIDSPAQKMNRGTGLGLPLTRKLATLLGGRVIVESEPAIGSTFIVELPLSYAGPLEGSYISHSKPAETGARKTVLIVDDDESDRKQLREILNREWNCEFIEAHNGHEGLRIAHQHRVDLFIIDLVMPELSGWEVFRAIREMESTRSTPVIVHSSQVISSGELEWLESHGARFVSKHSSVEEKLESIRRSIVPFKAPPPAKENKDVASHH